MDLKKLSADMPYKWRVQSFSKSYPSAQCVAYIDARDVMNRLDEVVGIENWQSDFKQVGDKIYGGIGIFNGKDWVWKWDCGTESNQDAEKGQASDAFKRAGVKWGIGRFLYDLEIQRVKTDGVKSDSNKFPKVIDDSGKVVYDLTKYINDKYGRK